MTISPERTVQATRPTDFIKSSRLLSEGEIEVQSMAREFAARGRHLALCARRIDRLEELRDAWFEAPDLETQRRLAREIQLTAFEEVPYIPLGAYTSVTAFRRALTGRIPGFALFWNLRRA